MKTDGPFPQEACPSVRGKKRRSVNYLFHQFKKCLLSSYYLPGLILDSENTAANKTIKASVSGSLLINQGGHRW